MARTWLLLLNYCYYSMRRFPYWEGCVLTSFLQIESCRRHDNMKSKAKLQVSRFLPRLAAWLMDKSPLMIPPARLNAPAARWHLSTVNPFACSVHPIAARATVTQQNIVGCEVFLKLAQSGLPVHHFDSDDRGMLGVMSVVLLVLSEKRDDVDKKCSQSSSILVDKPVDKRFR